MKRNSLVTMCLLILLMGTVKAQELTIIDQDYEKAVKESKSQHKLLLIDFYTTWCGPCKVLDRVVYQDQAFARTISKDFIVLKYDAEQDSVHQLTLKHHIGLYPTTLILNEEQRVVAKLYGMGGSEADMPKNFRIFLDEGLKKAANKYFISGISADNHLNYPKFYKDYIYGKDLKNSKEKVAAYWNANTDYLSEVPFAILAYFIGGTDSVDNFFLNNKKKYEALYGEQDVRFVVSMMVGDKVNKAIQQKDRPSFNTAIQFARDNATGSDIAPYINAMEEKMLMAEQRWGEAVVKFEVRKATPGFNEDGINNFCWSAYLNCNDPEVLKKCTTWMKQVNDKRPTYTTLDTYSRLLHKTGNKPLAITKIKEAIKIGKTNKEDTSDSETWLKKIGD